MSNIVNILAFLVLTGMMLTYMLRYSARIKNPLRKSQYLLIEGCEMFFIILMATGSMALSGGGGGRGAGSGFNLQSIRLAVLELLLVFSYFTATRKPVWSPAAWVYTLYIIWITYTLTYSPDKGYGVRYILKYIYPLLIMMAASAIVRDKEIFLSVCVWVRRIALISTLALYLPVVKYLLLNGFFWYDTALTIHYATVAALSFALYMFYGRDKKDLLIAIYFVIPTILTVHRTGILAVFAALATFAFYRWKWFSLPYILVVVGIGMAVVVYIPAVHDKMFWKDTDNKITISDIYSGNISDDDIRNNGREALWNMLEERFYEGHELKGSGIGSCQWLLYSDPNIVKQTHGDYIQMRCDTGLIGMGLYILVAVVILIHCFIICVTPYVPEHIKCCAMITAGSIVGNYAAMYSDNAVTYTMVTTGYAFAFYGMTVGMMQKVNKPQVQLQAGSL